MKFMIVGDIHIRDTKPQFRIDNFTEAQYLKIKWVLDQSLEQQCNAVLTAGDVTDTPKLSYFSAQRYIHLFRQHSIPIISPYGQHDLLYHVDRDNTPLKTMEVSGSIQTAGEMVLGPGVRLYCVSWEQKIPVVEYLHFKILLIHKLFVVEEGWPGQEAEYVAPFLMKTNWDLIVSGDNHQHFIHNFDNRYLINCGSLMRQSIDQIDHHPVCYIFDTELRKATMIEIPHEPAEQVFAIEEVMERKEKINKLDAFVSKISGSTEITGLDFVANLGQRLSMDDISEGIRKLSQEVMKNAAEKLNTR